MRSGTIFRTACVPPVQSHVPPMNEPINESESSLVDPSDRAALHGMLTGLLPLLKPLEAEGLRSAAENCLAILALPGPLRKVDAAPFVREVHERCAELFRRGAAEMRGEEREVLTELAEQADQGADSLRQLEGQSPDPRPQC